MEDFVVFDGHCLLGHNCSVVESMDISEELAASVFRV
jgi:serine/threonine protein phosphatase PrpC